MEFEEVISKAKDLIKKDLSETIGFLEIQIDDVSERYASLILFKGRLQAINQEVVENVISFENEQLAWNRIRRDLLTFIDGLEQRDIRINKLDWDIEEADLEAQVNALKERNRDLKRRVNRLEVDLRNNQYGNDRLIDENSQLREEIETLRSRVEQYAKASKLIDSFLWECDECGGKGYIRYRDDPQDPLSKMHKKLCPECGGRKQVPVSMIRFKQNYKEG